MNFNPAIWGAVTGTMGLAVALLVFFRDAPRVVVTMNWDMSGYGHMAGGGAVVLIAIANVGRRAIYLSHAHIPYLEGGGAFLFDNGIAGVTLAEGTGPHIVWAYQAGLEAGFADQWWRARAQVVDVTGRSYRSRWPTKRPSFGSGEPPPVAPLIAGLLNAFDTLRLRLLA